MERPGTLAWLHSKHNLQSSMCQHDCCLVETISLGLFVPIYFTLCGRTFHQANLEMALLPHGRMLCRHSETCSGLWSQCPSRVLCWNLILHVLVLSCRVCWEPIKAWVFYLHGWNTYKRGWREYISPFLFFHHVKAQHLSLFSLLPSAMWGHNNRVLFRAILPGKWHEPAAGTPGRE